MTEIPKPLPPSNNCPYLSIMSEAVTCKATNWGVGLDGQQKYGPISRTLIVHCCSPEHIKCSMYRRAKFMEIDTKIKKEEYCPSKQ